MTADLRDLYAAEVALLRRELASGRRDLTNLVLLDGAELSGIEADGADFTGSTLRRANLRRAGLRRARFAWANLRNADLSGAQLLQADFGGADLRGACFRGADLRHANLHSTDLRGADLRGALLDGVGLSMACDTFLEVHVDAAVLRQVAALMLTTRVDDAALREALTPVAGPLPLARQPDGPHDRGTQ